MRIAHITDLHCSRDPRELNKWDLIELLDALLSGLETEHAQKKIDLVFISGDLVNRGGRSYGAGDPFDAVEKTVLDRIAETLGLTHDKIVIGPGNHDVIEREDTSAFFFLKGLRSEPDIPSFNNVIDNNYKEWHNTEIDGLKKFKEFEQRFYERSSDTNTVISHSNFESCFTFTFEKAKIGVAAFNSAWSCSSKLDQSDKCKLAFGTSQIHRAGKALRNTDLNIAMLHHPINMGLYNEEEEKEMKTLLTKYRFNILFCGHTHCVTDNYTQEPEAMYYLIVTKSGFNSVREKNDKYGPGFCLIDLSYSSENTIKLSRYYRKFLIESKRFDLDVVQATRGMSTYEIRSNHFGKNFINFLRSQNVLFDPQRKELFEKMNILSLNYTKSPFPEVTDIALKRGLERFLPREAQFNHIRKNFRIEWEVRHHSEGYYALYQVQSFDIQSTKKPFLLTSRVFADTIQDGKDQTSIKVLLFEVDGKDISSKFIPSTEPLDPQVVDDGTAYVRKRKVFYLEHELKDKESYRILRKTVIVNALSNKKAWTFYPINIFQGYEFIINDPEERFHIELFGTADDLYASNQNEKGLREKQIRISRPDDILIPGDKFWLFISS